MAPFRSLNKVVQLTAGHEGHKIGWIHLLSDFVNMVVSCLNYVLMVNIWYEVIGGGGTTISQSVETFLYVLTTCNRPRQGLRACSILGSFSGSRKNLSQTVLNCTVSYSLLLKTMQQQISY